MIIQNTWVMFYMNHVHERHAELVTNTKNCNASHWKTIFWSASEQDMEINKNGPAWQGHWIFLIIFFSANLYCNNIQCIKRCWKGNFHILICKIGPLTILPEFPYVTVKLWQGEHVTLWADDTVNIYYHRIAKQSENLVCQ